MPLPECRRGFHLRRDARTALGLEDELFAYRGDVVFASHADARRVAHRLSNVSASDLFAMGVLHEMNHALLEWGRARAPRLWEGVCEHLRSRLGEKYRSLLLTFVEAFPPSAVFRGEMSGRAYLDREHEGATGEAWAIEEMFLLWLTNQNRAYRPIASLVRDDELRNAPDYGAAMSEIADALRAVSANGTAAAPGTGGPESLYDLLVAPMNASPDSIVGQLQVAKERWAVALKGTRAFARLVSSESLIAEESRWRQTGVGDGSWFEAPSFVGAPASLRLFSQDSDWMPKVVLLAKSTFVWLDQLSKSYQREIRTLGDIPDEELKTISERGFTGLWLIGVWKRSEASRTIKQRMGNPDAAPSAYALHSYDIADDLGGEEAYENLRDRAASFGLRLASDMVPNHMGIDSDWVIRHPDWFIQTSSPPFPSHTFRGPDLGHGDVSIVLEDGYWNHSDAAPEFVRVDRRTGETRYLYHGNDGTSLPWNDTAQLDLLKPEVREALIQTILHVARKFPIVRFDAAMTFAKEHVQRLWYPRTGSSGGVPSRSDHAMSEDEFNVRMPKEFWREVVDRVAKEAPETLLLAEAFWMMEGYFVRTLGMHRVYNSAFMNMMKNEDNAGYRRIMKEVLAYDPEILCRFVNFMNNPDEAPAALQYGKGEKYFGVCTLLATLPGLPMFGHGQLEGFSEKYGMEFRRAQLHESVDVGLLEHHLRAISPLLRQRALFSGARHFRLFDFVDDHGHVDESVYAYTNQFEGQRTLVVYKNAVGDRRRGRLRESAPGPDGSVESIGQALGIDPSRPRVLILQNARTGEEIGFDSREILSQGLSLELGGFEALVFVNVHEADERPSPPQFSTPVREVSPLEEQIGSWIRALAILLRRSASPAWSAEQLSLSDVAGFVGRHDYSGHSYIVREPFQTLVTLESLLRCAAAPDRALEIGEHAKALLKNAERCGYRADLIGGDVP